MFRVSLVLSLCFLFSLLPQLIFGDELSTITDVGNNDNDDVLVSNEEDNKEVDYSLYDETLSAMHNQIQNNDDDNGDDNHDKQGDDDDHNELDYALFDENMSAGEQDQDTNEMTKEMHDSQVADDDSQQEQDNIDGNNDELATATTNDDDDDQAMASTDAEEETQELQQKGEGEGDDNDERLRGFRARLARLRRRQAALLRRRRRQAALRRRRRRAAFLRKLRRQRRRRRGSLRRRRAAFLRRRARLLRRLRRRRRGAALRRRRATLRRLARLRRARLAALRRRRRRRRFRRFRRRRRRGNRLTRGMARCVSSGDPHIQTFDKLRIHPMGSGSKSAKNGWYYAVTGCVKPGSVASGNYQYTDLGFTIQLYLRYTRIHRGAQAEVSVTAGIKFTTAGTSVQVLGRSRGQPKLVNAVTGATVTSTSSGSVLKVTPRGRSTQIVYYKNGKPLAVATYFYGRATIFVSKAFKNNPASVCGLCGAYNGQRKLTLELCNGRILNSAGVSKFGAKQGTMNIFSQSYRVGNTCSKSLGATTPVEPAFSKQCTATEEKFVPVCTSLYANNKCNCLNQEEWIKECKDDAATDTRCHFPSGTIDKNHYSVQEKVNECKIACTTKAPTSAPTPKPTPKPNNVRKCETRQIVQSKQSACLRNWICRKYMNWSFKYRYAGAACSLRNANNASNLQKCEEFCFCIFNGPCRSQQNNKYLDVLIAKLP